MSNPLNLPEDDAWTMRLRALQPHGPAEPRPFFFARLQARLAVQHPQPTLLPSWLRRAAYAFSIGALVLVLNADTALQSVR